MPRATLKSLIWSPRYTGIYRCAPPPDTAQGREMKVSVLKVAGGEEIDGDADLKRVLETLQEGFVKRRVDTAAGNPTSRVVAFRPPEPDEENQGKALLEGLLKIDSGDLGAIRTATRRAAERYVKALRARPGVLIFLVSQGQWGDKEPQDCVFVFKCDFEAISRTDKDHLFEKVKEAIVEKTRKAALYPVFGSGRFDRKVAQIFDERGTTDYWMDFLELGERAGTPPPIAKETGKQVAAVAPDIPLAPIPTSLPPRSLRSDRRSVPPKGRIDSGTARKILEALAKKKLDPMITLRLDQVRVSGPLSRLFQSWAIAEQGDEVAILVKGSELENRTPVLTVLDLLDFDELEETVQEFFPQLGPK